MRRVAAVLLAVAGCRPVGPPTPPSPAPAPAPAPIPTTAACGLAETKGELGSAAFSMQVCVLDERGRWMAIEHWSAADETIELPVGTKLSMRLDLHRRAYVYVFGVAAGQWSLLYPSIDHGETETPLPQDELQIPGRNSSSPYFELGCPTGDETLVAYVFEQPLPEDHERYPLVASLRRQTSADGSADAKAGSEPGSEAEADAEDGPKTDDGSTSESETEAGVESSGEPLASAASPQRDERRVESKTSPRPPHRAKRTSEREEVTPPPYELGGIRTPFRPRPKAEIVDVQTGARGYAVFDFAYHTVPRAGTQCPARGGPAPGQ